MIALTNDSSPGLDGIPFSAWRAIGSHIAVVITDLLGDLAVGLPPSPGSEFDENVLHSEIY